MLHELRVVDFALLAQAQLEFAPGFVVLTGETGDGKSLVLGAISLLCGARSRQGLVRTGAQQAVIEGRFSLTPVLAAALAQQCDLVESAATELVLRRVILADGSSRAYLDGQLCTVSMLARVGGLLLGFHGQDEQRLLRDAQRQAALLDAFAGLRAESTQWTALRDELRLKETECAALREKLAVRDTREQWLRSVAAELDAARAETGEESRLAAQHRLLSGGRAFATDLEETQQLLSEGDGALADVAARSARKLRAHGAGHAASEELCVRLEALESECRELSRSCGALLDALDLDPQQVAAMEERLDLLRTLARKYRVRPDDLHEHAATVDAELTDLHGEAERLEQLEAERVPLLESLRALATRMLTQRRSAAKKLARAVEGVLADLRMPAARVEIATEPERIGADFDPLAAPEHGPGAVHMLLSANAGEALQPVERVASGGETARILLALETALAKVIPVPLLVFDEIDAGVGGRVGAALGRHLAVLAATRQVLVVTHLPQVAAHAAQHWRVCKSSSAGRTVTRVELLQAEARVQEIAAMLGDSGAARAQAKALLAEAKA